MAFVPSPGDPFYDLMKPPVDETPAQRTARQKRELDAQRASDLIDEEIKQERRKKSKNIIRMLLLGQAESGKSTTLKNFRMQYAPEAWERERSGWRTVVQLNIVRSILSILKVLEAELNGDQTADSDDENSTVGVTTGSSYGSVDDEPVRFTDRHQLLLIRLAPLRHIEAELKRRLNGSSSEPMQDSVPLQATPFADPELGTNVRRKPEFFVRSWKTVLSPGAAPEPSMVDREESITAAIADRKDDMKSLWDDRALRLTLKRRRLHLPDSAGFFLNDLDRIATRDYVVTDDDIVRARLRTVGIQEHRLFLTKPGWDTTKGGKGGWEWRIFDVGGCRTSRAAWTPYFENVNVIIFLSPVSVFDQRLEEDSRVNRLEDSILLWTSICSSPLLSKVQLVLFLNKCDLLRRKLRRGIRVNQYLPSYGDRANEVMTVVKYFREKFRDILRQNSPEHRTAYIYPTTVTDTNATRATLEIVRDGVLRENLATSHLI